jgi:hypothetical protein
MRIRFAIGTCCVIGALIVSASLRGEPPKQATKESPEMELFSPDAIKWHEGPPSLPKGALIAVLEVWSARR